MTDRPTTPPLLIAMPHGLNVSGVTLWAVRLANALAAGIAVNTDETDQHNKPDQHNTTKPSGVGLVVHQEPAGHEKLPLPLHPDIVLYNARHLPSIEDAHGDLEPFITTYRNAARDMNKRFGSPVVLSPNLQGDYYGVAARLTQTEPLHVVAWQHSDIEYNTRLFQHYAPCIARFVAVSDHIGQTLRKRIPDRAEDVASIPYGVSVPDANPHQDAASPGDRPVRLIYTGRMEQEQKRAGLLVLLSDELDRRNIAHTLTMVGEAPATRGGGGQFLRGIRTVTVSVLPLEVPEEIEVSIEGLENIGDNIRVEDLILPEGVVAISSPDQVVARIAMTRTAAVEVGEGMDIEEGAEGEEGEEGAEGEESEE